jgi:hypothetical protein
MGSVDAGTENAIAPVADDKLFQMFVDGLESWRRLPQALLPGPYHAICGTIEVVPIENTNDHACERR